MRGRYAALTVLALVAGLGAGIGFERERAAGAATGDEDGSEILYWVAPMDANFRKDGPGKSPMGMDLVPVYEGDEAEGDPEEVRLSPAEVNAIGVRTATARMEEVARRIDTVGFVAFDAHRTSHVHTRVEGWIERLALRAVGDSVAAGDLLFELYAPDITIASSELMRAMRGGDPRQIANARTKLRNLGVGPRQIDEMEGAETPAAHIRYYAPQDGVVTALTAADGMYLRPETRAMTLTDLSRVWLLVDVFERDMARLDPGMTAEVRIDHLPGRVFTGEIDYIMPTLDAQTRTVQVRLRFDNAEGLLKPGMLARVALIPGRSREALTIPSEAVIRTGRAERVILQTEEGHFRPRLVTTGLRGGFGAGGRTEVVQGLAPGEVVVASAQFLIDSESALNAGMMRFAPTEAAPVTGRGRLLALDPDTRRARIRHDAIAALDWPAMETVFALRADLRLDALAAGEDVAFDLVRGADGLLTITRLGRDDGIAATGEGIVHAVTPDGKLSISHDPIPALDWPAMTMDLDVAGIDPGDVPLETPVSFDLAEDAGGMFTIVDVRAAGADAATPEAEDAPAPDSAAPITVEGRTEAVDAAARVATIAHGPITEIGMPGMTMEFALADDLDAAALRPGQEAVFTFERPDGMTMILAGVEERAPPLTVTGMINAVADGMANITHGPIADIGMPGMTMEFALAEGLDPAALPIGQEAELLLEQGTDLSLTLVGIRELTE